MRPLALLMIGIDSPKHNAALRLVSPADAELLFRWRNDPWIVGLSTSRRPVTWAEHLAWFESMMERSQHLLYIIQESDGTGAGTVRLDREAPVSARISIYLLRPFTGRGLGTRAIAAASAEAFRQWPTLARIEAYIRADNQPSLKAFARSGYSADPAETRCPADHVLRVLRRAGE